MLLVFFNKLLACCLIFQASATYPPNLTHFLRYFTQPLALTHPIAVLFGLAA
jgi:hypothetical protein